MNIDSIIKKVKELNIDVKDKDEIISMLLDAKNRSMVLENSIKSYFNEIISEIKDVIVK